MKAELENHGVKLIPETPDEELGLRDLFGNPDQHGLTQVHRRCLALATHYNDLFYVTIFPTTV